MDMLLTSNNRIGFSDIKVNPESQEIIIYFGGDTIDEIDDFVKKSSFEDFSLAKDEAVYAKYKNYRCVTISKDLSSGMVSIRLVLD